MIGKLLGIEKVIKTRSVFELVWKTLGKPWNSKTVHLWKHNIVLQIIIILCYFELFDPSDYVKICFDVLSSDSQKARFVFMSSVLRVSDELRTDVICTICVSSN